MKFVFLGSGGALRIPRACCSCAVCAEAREKGFPYKRLGQSLYIEDGAILFDTPEDINEELNAHAINEVQSIFYSHWHPDHTMGCRIIETLMDEKTERLPIDVYMPQNGISVSLNNSDVFAFYESQEFCKINTLSSTVKFANFTVSPILLKNGYAIAFLLETNSKRVLYCPCHAMHLPINNNLINLDLIIMNLGTINTVYEDVTAFERDSMRIINELNPKSVIFTHIEETEGMGFSDFEKLEEQYENVRFAYDGMRVEIF